MNQLTTVGIVLTRTDFGEADRIITMLTPDYGKLRLMAKGVRRIKSKLAGGIELFSTSHITFIRGRGDIDTLISSRLEKYYAKIVQDLNRTMLGYDLIKLLNRVTEDQTEAAYFQLMQTTLESLNDSAVPIQLISTWFSAQLLELAGHIPNLQTDDHNQKLEVDKNYTFNFDQMAFQPSPTGNFTANHIKLLRLLFGSSPPQTLWRIQGEAALLTDLEPTVKTMLKTHIRI
ncbi:MAG TPA: DNA repair protein RecO [Candidatus Binatia bacterium]|jgi:DNA repair protein RecO|nr:DNA repair protein RecO [Candidatus Binatia bacterium]